MAVSKNIKAVQANEQVNDSKGTRLKVEGQKAIFEVVLEYTDSGEEKIGKVFCLPLIGTEEFLTYINELFACAFAELGAKVFKNGKNVPPIGEDVLVISKRSNELSLITKDGRKFILSNGVLNEAQ